MKPARSIFDPPAKPMNLLPRSLIIRLSFERFHRDNPQVFTRLREMAMAWQAAGHKRCGLKMLFEVLRWEHGLRTTGEPFRLNNNYTAHYARLLMRHECDLEGFFETRGAK